MSNIKAPLGFLVALLLLIGVVYAGFVIFGSPSRSGNEPSGSVSQSVTAPPPPPSPQVLAQLAKSKGFAVLISYTDRGFEPSKATLKQGEAARFTNNSSSDLWIADAGDGKNSVYPGTSDCGTSALDTCRALKPQEFWEFTFDASGTWSFRNNLDKGKIGTVQVQVTQ